MTAERHQLDLTGVVAAALTAKTTAALPPLWRGDFTEHRAEQWIADRDAESATLLAVDQLSGQAIGFLILFETTHDNASGIDLRIGYIITESAWGRGMASELVEGLVEWACAQSSIRSISGGVADRNPASARVLTKNGFSPAADSSGDEQIYELRINN